MNGRKMPEVIFAKPVYKYDSYTDFWQLVELSDFPIISVSDIDITQDKIIITAPMNGDYKEHFVGDLDHYQETGEITGGQLMYQKISGLSRLAHLIVWNLERPSSSGSVGEYAKESMEWITRHRYCDEVWVSDSALADEAMLRYVTLGSDYGLGEINDQKRYDVTHQSSTGVLHAMRRTNIYNNLKNVGPNAWPWENPSRHDILMESKFALNIHQDNWGYCEPLRFALFAAYGLPIISETLTNSFPYNGDIQQFPYHNIVDSLRKKLCEDLQFGKVVRQAVSESVGIGWR
jgi:hypothetical protein